MSPPPPHHRPASVVASVHTWELQAVRNVVITVRHEGIEPRPTTATGAASSSSLDTDEIRPLRPSSDLSKHARDLLVSPPFFSPSPMSSSRRVSVPPFWPDVFRHGMFAGARAGSATPLPSKHARLHASSSSIRPLQGRPFPMAGLVRLCPCICSYAANTVRDSVSSGYLPISRHYKLWFHSLFRSVSVVQWWAPLLPIGRSWVQTPCGAY
jgi:hypothetical protein